MKLKINYREKNGKNTNMWRLNNMPLRNQWTNEEIKEEIRKYPETNENKYTGTSLVAQWLRICLPTQGTWV